VELGEPVDEPVEEFGRGVGLAVPGRVQLGIVEAEVRGQVDDGAHPSDELGHQVLALAVGQSQKDEVEPVEHVGIRRRIGQSRVGGGQGRRVGGDHSPGVAPCRGHGHVECGMVGAQAEQLDAGIARRPDDSDLHGLALMDVPVVFLPADRRRCRFEEVTSICIKTHSFVYLCQKAGAGQQWERGDADRAKVGRADFGDVAGVGR
jgi:hypothetical protein